MSVIKRAFDKFEEVIAVSLFVVLIILGLLQVLFRFVLNFSLDWTEELSRYTFIFLVYMSASLAIMKDRHVRVEIIDGLVSPKTRDRIMFGVEIIWLLFSIIIAVSGVEVALGELTQTSPALGWSMGMMYMIIPFGFCLMSLRLLQKIISRFRVKEVA